MVQHSAQDSSQLIAQALEAFKARDRDAAAALLTRATDSNAALGRSWGSVAKLAAAIGEAGVALEAGRRLVETTAGDPAPRFALAQMLAQFGRIQEARNDAEALVRDRPFDGAAWHLLGTCEAQLGDMAASRRSLRRALDLHRSPLAMAWTWHSLAEGKRFKANDPDLAAISNLIARIPPSAEGGQAQALLNLALGKAYDDLGAENRAFAAYATGARLTLASRPYNADAADVFARQMIEGWSQTFHKGTPPGIEADRPIFVLGLPRSGSTLVEQILTTHSDVSDGGEINLFSAAAMPIGGVLPQPVAAFANQHGADGFAAVGLAYLHLLDERFGVSGRVVDKTLNHSRYLGLIARVLPQARFVWMRRSPGAVAWSCFRTRFAGGADWSWDLRDMGRHFAAEDRLRDHWSEILGDRVLHLPYDELVVDPDTWIARLLDHVGLPFQEGLKSFHETERAVATASFAQVRRPLYTTSREAWRRYERHLQPFFDAYGQPPS